MGNEKLVRLGISERDLREKFVRASGKGGQNVNKVATCVILTHVPSGITIRCDEERSQAKNRDLARKRLAEKYERMILARLNSRRQAEEKEKRQKRGRNRTAKERILKEKHHRSQIKRNRRAESWD